MASGSHTGECSPRETQVHTHHNKCIGTFMVTLFKITQNQKPLKDLPTVLNKLWHIIF